MRPGATFAQVALKKRVKRAEKRPKINIFIAEISQSGEQQNRVRNVITTPGMMTHGATRPHTRPHKTPGNFSSYSPTLADYSLLSASAAGKPWLPIGGE
jgi:hypothetical protein